MKKALRRLLRADSRSVPERQHRSEEIVRRLTSHPVVRSAGTVMLFCPLPDEPDISGLLDILSGEGKTVLLPRVVDEQQMEVLLYTGQRNLRVGAFGIQEPVGDVFSDYRQIDVVLVPGMAFDASGRRLGRGRGYYDRFLAHCPSSMYKIGVCFSFRLLESVPSEPHDVIMDDVVTD